MYAAESFQERYERFIRRTQFRIRLSRWPLLASSLGEFFGTCILIVIGLGVICQQELGNKGNYEHGGFLVIPITWGIAIIVAVFVAGSLGSGNINPAVTLAFALIGRVPFKRILPYTLAQILGACFGALLLIGVYNEKLNEHDALTGHLMNTTGKIFVTRPHISHFGCFVDQFFGTALLAGLALAIVDRDNFATPKQLEPLYLGFMVTGLVATFALNAGAALNPARDFGPRMALAMTGWGSSAFTDSNFYFWVPIVAPYLGAFVGSVFYILFVGAHLPGKFDEDDRELDSEMDPYIED